MTTATTTPKDFAVASTPAWRILWLWVPMLGVIALVAGTNLAHPQRTAMDVGLTVPFLLLLCGVLTWAYRRRRLRLMDGQLEVVSTLYRKRVPVASMALERARIVDLAEHTELKPGLKINGFGMPGFQSGHYRIGSRKAFCLVTDSSRVLHLPLRDGSALLISPEQPRVLLETLNAAAAR